MSIMKKKTKLIFCKKCLYSSLHPLNITFNEEGICSGCRIHDEKDIIDWKDRLDAIKFIIKKYKSKKYNYDCIVPVSGGQDSYYIVHLVKNILNLNPLLVCYNKYFNTSISIKNLSNLRIKFDCDIIFKNINPNIVKKITRYTFSEFGNIYWPILAGQTVFPLEVSEKFKIPLIIWGAHQGVEQVGMFSHLDNVEMSQRYRNEHDLFGLDPESLLQSDNSINQEDIWQYLYPSDSTINQNGIRGIYLSNYFRWDPYMQHKKMVKLYGYQGSRFNRTFDVYDHVDCYNYMGIHDVLKLAKHGYSKVTDHVCREIRHKRLTRYEGLKIVRKYELKPSMYTKQFTEWLGTNQRSLDFVINQFKDEKYWKLKKNLDYSFCGNSTKIIEREKKIFKKRKKYEYDNFKKYFDIDGSYITFGKGL